MALRDQPYIPLYVQDVLTDEKLILCSAESHGVYLRLICILHKQETYGLFCLKQKHKQNESKYKNFASLLSKQMPFDQQQIERCLIELSDEDVIQVTENDLSQKRMMRDGELSLTRSIVGKMGGSNVTKQYGKKGFLYWMGDYDNKNKIGISVSPQNRLYRLRSDLKLKNFDIQDCFEVKDMGLSEDLSHEFFSDLLDGEWVKISHDEMKIKFDLLKAKLQAKTQANTEYEIECENVSELLLNEILKRKPDYKKPDLEKWASSIDLMIRVDKRNPDEIKKVIIWCQQDKFWQNNILSTSKLREQFDQLSLKMNSKPIVKTFIKQESPYEICKNCGSEYRRGELIKIKGKDCCHKCPETIEQAKQVPKDISGLTRRIG